MGAAYRPCAHGGCHVLVWCGNRAARPRCPQHLYPEKAMRSRFQARAAAIVRGSLCVRCGAPAEQADHPVPLSRGGDPAVMQPLCRPCHQAKTRGELNFTRP
jgi:5-methylcytosine-specific restriction endonuclease McrA